MSKSDSSSKSITDDDDDEVVEESFVQHSSHKGNGTLSKFGQSMHNSSVEVSDSGSDDEPIGVRRKSKKKVLALLDSEDESEDGNALSRLAASSEDDDDEESLDGRALSPRTRMSITGFRPPDLTDDESDISDSQESSVHSAFSDEDELHSFDPENPDRLADTKHDSIEDSASASGKSCIAERNSATVAVNSKDDESSNANALSSVGSENGDEESLERKALSPRTRMSITGFRPRDLTGDESDIFDSHSENPVKSAATNRNSLEDRTSRKSGIAERNSPTRSEKGRFSTRISTNFNESIISKLSSTVLETNGPHLISDNSIIESPQEAIELSSDSSQSINMTPRLKPIRTVQPKIVDVLDLTRTQEKLIVNYVSKEFLDEQLRKLNELRSELVTCENLVNTLGSKLPDKGKRMSGRGERLRSEIANLAQYITTLKVEDGAHGSVKHPTKSNTALPPTHTWEELANAANSIQPKYTGKVGMANFIVQKTLTIERLKDIHGSLETCPDENILADDPKNLKISLMQHQKHALAWMYWREKQKPRGGILADDMGLGKTLTMISLILASKERIAEDSQDESDDDDDDDDDNNTGGWSAKGRRDYYNGGTLIVCPASLIRQWESEVTNRVKSNKLTVCVYHGNNREARPRTLAKYDMVITTYNLVPREMSSGVLFNVKWDRIILDEAHIIRNHKSKSSEAVCGLRAKHRWVLTGTPIQNKEMDMYALLKFLKCTPFDELAHWKKWIDNKSAGGQQRLNTLMKSLMLRRTKLQLQEFGTLTLPEKSLQIVEVSLENDEMNVYQKIMLFSRTLFAQFLYQRAERNNDFVYQSEGNKPTYQQTKDPNGAYYRMHQKFSRLDKNAQVKSTDILVLLLRLRQICCHPGLIDSMLEDEDQSAHIEESHSDEGNSEIDLLDQLNKLQINDDCTNTSQGADNLNNNEKAISKTLSKALLRSNPVFDLKRPSSKMKNVIKTLETKILNTTDKAIVVSQWTSVLNILQEHLSAKRIPLVCLNGSVPVKLRNDIVNDFNNPQSNKRVMLLSLTAGGVGLNLIGANHLLLMDLHWNPQLEAQAQDRIYRVGQKKSVQIYKFMCKETVEERIKTLQDHKLAIANGVLTGVKASEGSKLSIDDLKSLFGL